MEYLGGGVAEMIYLLTHSGSFSIWLTEVSTGKVLLENFYISNRAPIQGAPLTVGKEYRIDASYEWYSGITFAPSNAARVTSSYKGGSGPRNGWVQFIPTSTDLNAIILDFETSA